MSLEDKRQEEKLRQRLAKEQCRRQNQKDRRSSAGIYVINQHASSLQCSSRSLSSSGSKDNEREKKIHSRTRNNIRNSEILTCSLCSTKCSGQEAMQKHLLGREDQTGKHKSRMTSVSQQLASHSASPTAAPFGPRVLFTAGTTAPRINAKNTEQTAQNKHREGELEKR